MAQMELNFKKELNEIKKKRKNATSNKASKTRQHKSMKDCS
jgi:hypothetical protein